MSGVLRAGAGIALVLVVPGVLVLLAARVRLTIVEWLALAPACSLGAVFVLAEFVMVVGIPFAPTAFFVMLVVLAVVVVIRMRRGWVRPVLDRSTAEHDPAGRSRRRGVLVAGALVVFAIGIAGVTWVHGMEGRATIAPGSDAMNHAFMIRRISDAETIDPRHVVTIDSSGMEQAQSYYPLSLHASLAIAHRVTDSSIGYLLNGAIVFFAALVFPLSLFALTRYLVPTEPLAAGFAAVVGVLVTMFPYQPIQWGLIPLAAAMTLVPITVMLLLRTAGSGWSHAAAALTALVVVGVFSLHSSEIPLIAGLAVLGVVFTAGRQWTVLRHSVSRLVVVGVGALVLLIPTLPNFFSGAGELKADRISGTTDLGGFLGRLITLHVAVPDRQGWLVVLALAGVGVLLWRREQTAWIVAAAVVGGLAVLAATSYNTVTNALTFPWYRQAFRVSYNVAFFVPVFAGVLLGFGVRWLARRLPARRLVLPAMAGIALVVLYPVSGAQAWRANRRLVMTSYTTEAPVRRVNVDAFEYMKSRLRPGERVLTDAFIDAGTWMYSLSGVPTVFGLTPYGKHRTQTWQDRLDLRDHITELGTSDVVAGLVRRFRVRFVYYGEATVPEISGHVIKLGALRSSPVFREVFNRGGAHVFEIQLPPTRS